MTNAELIAKDINFISRILSDFNCNPYYCDNCPMLEKFGICTLGVPEEQITEYLEEYRPNIDIGSLWFLLNNTKCPTLICKDCYIRDKIKMCPSNINKDKLTEYLNEESK